MKLTTTTLSIILFLLSVSISGYAKTISRKTEINQLKKEGWKAEPGMEDLNTQFLNYDLVDKKECIVSEGVSSGKTFSEAYIHAYIHALSSCEMQKGNQCTMWELPTHSQDNTSLKPEEVPMADSIYVYKLSGELSVKFQENSCEVKEESGVEKAEESFMMSESFEANDICKMEGTVSNTQIENKKIDAEKIISLYRKNKDGQIECYIRLVSKIPKQ